MCVKEGERREGGREGMEIWHEDAEVRLFF